VADARAAAADRDRGQDPADEDKLSLAKNLARLVAGDPTLRLERNPETHQLVLWCMGEAHADVVLDRLRARRRRAGHRAGEGGAARDVRRKAAKGTGRHVKQSGGHGQYAVCDIEVEPLPRGSGIRVRGQGRRRRGAAAVHPVGREGRTGPDGARASPPATRWSTCGSRCWTARRTRWTPPTPRSRPPVRSRCARRPPTPGSSCWSRWTRSASWVSDDYVGAVMSDLSGRRGRVVGTEQSGGGQTLIQAEVPEIEIGRYAVDLRSLSHGTGRFSRSYARHEPMPAQVAERVRGERAAAGA
jgi:elongation factor G